MEGRGAVLAGWGCLALVFAAAAVFFPPAGGRVTEETPPPSPPAAQGGREEVSLGGDTLRLVLPDGEVAAVELEEYVLGVLTAEMPAAFSPAALEAQAVAARTYALRRIDAGPHSPGADLCADPACCQGYQPRPPESWGEDAPALEAKLRAAVAATAGEVLVRDGELIDAVFHASSQGFTAPAQAVWGAEVPYLVSVSTPETAETVGDLQAQAVFSRRELEEYLGSGELGQVRYYDWGGVESMAVGDGVLSGQEVRRRLGLRSARFQVELTQDGAVFTTTGYGHGVGMSQQGAELMARRGAGYRDILAHYYPGTSLEKR